MTGAIIGITTIGAPTMTAAPMIGAGGGMNDASMNGGNIMGVTGIDSRPART